MKLMEVICAAVVCFSAATLLGAEKKPNVLFIAVDDLRPELACYGQKQIKSPNIDKLAASGLQFNRAYCQLSLCNPSRASLLTGKRPETLGIFDLITNVRDAHPGIVTLPQLFKDNGYVALRYGKIFHTSNGNHDDLVSWSDLPEDGVTSSARSIKPEMAAKREMGSSVALALETAKASTAKVSAEKGPKKAKAKPEDLHANDLPYEAPDCADEDLADGKTAAKTLKMLETLKDRPFFLAVGFHKPHLPFVAPKRYWDLYDPQTIALASNPFLPKDAPAFASNDASELRRYKGMARTGPVPDAEARNLIHGYYASVSYTDAQVGKLLRKLEDLGLRENTIVILWGDHGYQLGEHGTWNKRTNWEIATRVPMIISVPGQTTRGRQTNALVELVDIFPSLVELCGLPSPSGLEGVSFTPLLMDPDRAWKTAAFSVYQRSIPEMGNGLSRAMRTDRYRLVEWKAEGNEKRVYELYDHKNDPQENTNIANLPENKAVLEKLAAGLKLGWHAARPARPSDFTP
jgi:iduronate 2-sulfatase